MNSPLSADDASAPSDGLAAAQATPRSAYIHVPFCRHRCGYCNFTLVAGRDDLIDAYLDAMRLELERLGQPRPVDTLFLGGGTPSHLPPLALARLLDLVRHWFPLRPGGEWSVEVNPCDLTDDKAAQLAAAGIQRVSLGIQSFHAAKLELLERDHRQPEIDIALRHAHRHFRSVAIDLIFGVPGETLVSWQADLSQAIAAGAHHVSTYGLTFERGTAFWSRQLRGGLPALDEELERALYEQAIDQLVAAGFEHYEVSNFARPGHICRHNEAYWLGRPYFAAGPGAARYVAGRREVNHRSTTTYIRRLQAGLSPVAEWEQLAPEDVARERLVFGLRRLAGVDRTTFARETQFSIEQLVGDCLPALVEAGLLAWHDDRLRLTRAGLCISDAIWPKFLRS